jgi:hypothetical protein
MSEDKKECKYGDPACPCQDGDACHYEGENPLKKPTWWHRVKAKLEKDADVAGEDFGNALGEAFANRQ